MPNRVRRIIQVSGIVMLMLAAMLLLPACEEGTSIGRDFNISQYDVSCQIQQDGSAIVTETVAFVLSNDTARFDFNIDYEDYGSIDLMQVAIASGKDGSSQYLEIQPSGKDLQNNTAYFDAKDNGSSLNIEVDARSEAGTRRLIRLQYVLSTAIVRQSDHVLLLHPFFRSAGAHRVDVAQLTVTLPPTTMDLGSWVTAVSLDPFVEGSSERDMIVYEGGPLSAGADMTLYALFSPNAFPKAAKGSGNLVWDDVTEMAGDHADRLAWTDQNKRTVRALVLVLLGASILLILLIYWLFDREAVASYRHRYCHDLPQYRRPAIISILLHKSRPGRLILSTLLDLVRRGELEMQGNIFSLPIDRNTQGKTLAAYERFLIHWLFEKIAKNSMISIAEIRKYARDHDTAGEMQAFYLRFRELIDHEIEDMKLMDQGRIRSGRMFAYISGMIYLLATIAASVYLDNPVGLLLLIPAVCMVVYGWKIRRLSVSGRELQARFQAVARTIRDGKTHDQPSGHVLYSDLLPIAEAMALSTVLIDNILNAGKTTGDPYEAFELACYGIKRTSRTWSAQLITLRADLKVMNSMLSASLLLSSGLHH